MCLWLRFYSLFIYLTTIWRFTLSFPGSGCWFLLISTGGVCEMEGLSLLSVCQCPGGSKPRYCQVKISAVTWWRSEMKGRDVSKPVSVLAFLREMPVIKQIIPLTSVLPLVSAVVAQRWWASLQVIWKSPKVSLAVLKMCSSALLRTQLSRKKGIFETDSCEIFLVVFWQLSSAGFV